MRRRRSDWLVLFIAMLVATAVASCAFGESEEPGCQSDAECGGERICREGACFRIIGDVDASFTEDDAG